MAGVKKKIVSKNKKTAIGAHRKGQLSGGIERDLSVEAPRGGEISHSRNRAHLMDIVTEREASTRANAMMILPGGLSVPRKSDAAARSGAGE